MNGSPPAAVVGLSPEGEWLGAKPARAPDEGAREWRASGERAALQVGRRAALQVGERAALQVGRRAALRVGRRREVAAVRAWNASDPRAMAAAGAFPRHAGGTLRTVPLTVPHSDSRVKLTV